MPDSADSAPTLELLLADASARRPVLEPGLPEDAANAAPKPDKVPRGVDSMLLDAPGADPNDLSKQRWGVIYADSEAGRRAFAAIAPLVASRIFSALNVLANGNRAGVALDALMRAYREVNDEILAGYQVEQEARLVDASYTPDVPRRAYAFMLRNDLRGYVLLGDPAVRLPLAQHWPSIEAKTSLSMTTSRAPEMEQAVLAVLAREGSTGEIAAKFGFGVEMLLRWVEVYKAAGRAALEKLKL